MIVVNFVEMIESSIKANWLLPAFSDYKDASVSYAEVADKLKWCHCLFENCRVKRGDKIALIGKNSTQWAITYLAAVTYGAIIVPVLTDFHVDDFHHIVNHSDAVLLFVSESIYEKLEESKMPHLEAILKLEDFSLFYSRQKHFETTLEKTNRHYRDDYNGVMDAEQFKLNSIVGHQAASIFYTSGTSGFSKGVVLAHESLAANVCFARKNIPLKSGDAILSFLPMANAFGCAFDFLFPFCVGGHITFLGKIPSPKILAAALTATRPRLVLSVPLLVEKIYKNNIDPIISKKHMAILMRLPLLRGLILKKIRQKLMDFFGNNLIEVVVGGAALNAEVEGFLKKIAFPYTIGYGMTECGPLISYVPYPQNRLYSVGKVVDTLEIRIDTAAVEGQAVDGAGEILVRGTNVMKGYYKNEEATAAAIVNGWLHTGDIGLVDADGFIFIKGRLKSMLLGSSGQNIYPEEIEARLNNFPYVGESLVIERDKRIIALVHPDYERVDADGLDEHGLVGIMEKIRGELNDMLPQYSRISQIDLFPEEFEKTPTKKIKRFLYALPLTNKN